MQRRAWVAALVCLALVRSTVNAQDEPIATEFEDDDLVTAAFLQPAAGGAASGGGGAGAAAAASTAARSSRSSYVRLSRAPNMLGDSLGQGGQFNAFVREFQPPPPVPPQPPPGTNTLFFTSDLPLGVARSLKISENNKSLPMDRVYFNYNGFQNALATSRRVGAQPPVASDQNVDLYTLGGEKTFFDQQMSLDVRMPLIGALQAGDGPVNIGTESIGDVSLFLKGLVYSGDSLSVAVGFGNTIPSASNVRGQIRNQPFALRNRTVHLLPYVGFLATPNDNWFFQGFLQGDFVAGGHTVLVGEQRNNLGVLTEQAWMYADFLVGRWLVHNPDNRYFQGTAAVAELHYATTLQDADLVPFGGPGFGGSFGNAFNRLDMLNLTGGLQVQVTELTNLRIACVVPLRTAAENRQFDTEISVSVNRFF